MVEISLEPQTTIYKWLFQLDDSKSLYRKWLFHQTSILNGLFGVPGGNDPCPLKAGCAMEFPSNQFISSMVGTGSRSIPVGSVA